MLNSLTPFADANDALPLPAFVPGMAGDMRILRRGLGKRALASGLMIAAETAPKHTKL
ncbi:hypothetical protein [Labrys neptuniae]